MAKFEVFIVQSSDPGKYYSVTCTKSEFNLVTSVFSFVFWKYLLLPPRIIQYACNLQTKYFIYYL